MEILQNANEMNVINLRKCNEIYLFWKIVSKNVKNYVKTNKCMREKEKKMMQNLRFKMKKKNSKILIVRTYSCRTKKKLNICEA